MRARWLAVAFCCFWYCSAALAEAPAVEEATDVAPAPPEPADTRPSNDNLDTSSPLSPDAPKAEKESLHLSFGQTLDEDTGRSIQDEISADLIVLSDLWQALKPQFGQEQIRLGIMECISFALESNPAIEIATFDPLIAKADEMAARGEFDPLLQSTAQYMRASQTLSQQSVAFGGITSVEDYRTTVSGGVVGKLHTGTQYSLMFDANKEETTFGNFIEEFDTRLTLTLTQPLLRGFGRGVNTVRIRIAENSRRISEEQLRLTVMNTVAEVISSYWEMVGAIETLKVRLESLSNAERLLDVSETRRRIGTAADLEVVQAKAGVATRQSDVISARAAIADASDRLKRAMNLQGTGLLSDAQIIPTDLPNPSESVIFDVDNFADSQNKSIALALKNRPEVVIADLDIKTAQLDMRRARNEMLPQLDLTGSYGRGGRDHKLSHALRGIEEPADWLYTYGFQASVPIGNRAARGAYQRARLTHRQAELRQFDAEQQLVLNARRASRNVLTNHTLVASSRQSVRLQEANVLAEEKRLRLGLTSSWQVLQIQEDLTAARTQEVQSRISYETALMDLQLAEGTLLENLGIEFEPVTEAEPVGYLDSIIPRWE